MITYIFGYIFSVLFAFGIFGVYYEGEGKRNLLFIVSLRGLHYREPLKPDILEKLKLSGKQ